MALTPQPSPDAQSITKITPTEHSYKNDLILGYFTPIILQDKLIAIPRSGLSLSIEHTGEILFPHITVNDFPEDFPPFNFLHSLPWAAVPFLAHDACTGHLNLQMLLFP